MWWLILACQSPQVSILPLNPTTQDELYLDVRDADGNILGHSDIQWFKDGVLQVEHSIVSSNWTERGQEWSATAMLRNGRVVEASSIAIENAAPNVEIYFEPSQPIENYEMKCVVDVSDDDDDYPLSTSFFWVNPEGERFEGATVVAADVQLGTWRCKASVDDGYGVFEVEQETKVLSLSELPEIEENLLLDASFDMGGFDDWILEGCEIVSMQGNRTPMHGDKMLFGGMDNCRAWQMIDLMELGFSEGHIDVQRLRARIEGYLANKGVADNYDDQIYLQLIYLDENEEELSRLRSMFGGEEAWVYREASRIIPVGTRRILATVEADWRVDQINDSFADGLSLSIDLAELLEPVLVKKPMLQGVKSSSQKIIWETDGVDYDPVVLWGENLENRATNIKSTWVDDGHIVHVAVIDGFEAGEAVPYQVPIEDLESAVFQTAPQRGDDFSITWLGDNQEAYTRFTTHVSHISDRNPNMLFVVGDMIQTSSVHNEWQQMWWNPLQEKDFAQYTQVLAARGNHDMDHPYAYAYVDLPENGSHYSFLYGDVFVLVLNTHADVFPSPDPSIYGQYNYLIDELNSPKAQNAAFRIVAFHQAPYSNSSASQTPDQIRGMQGVRDFWVPIFEEQEVDIVISGHYHSYQRGEHNGTTYLVTGGGGSTLLVQEFDYWDWLSLDFVYQYTMMHREEGRLRFETYDLEDQLIDSFTIE